MHPPNERAFWVVGGMALLLATVWYARERQRFPGPPHLASIISRDLDPKVARVS
jgi:hypothetical protein